MRAFSEGGRVFALPASGLRFSKDGSTIRDAGRRTGFSALPTSDLCSRSSRRASSALRALRTVESGEKEHVESSLRSRKDENSLLHLFPSLLISYSQGSSERRTKLLALERRTALSLSNDGSTIWGWSKDGSSLFQSLSSSRVFGAFLFRSFRTGMCGRIPMR